MAVAITFITQVASNSNLTTYTFPDVNIGTASADRLVVVCVSAYRSGATTISSATIGGDAATIIAQCVGQNTWVGLFAARVPSGTTATITVTHGAQALACSIGVFTVTGQASDTPFATDSPTGGSDSNRTATLTIPADGGVIASTVGNDGAANWTNITERFDVVVEGELNHSGASKTTSTLLTNDVISCVAIRAICAASWAPRQAVAAPKMMHYRRLRI